MNIPKEAGWYLLGIGSVFIFGLVFLAKSHKRWWVYWKQRAASWIFNYLWRDKDSGLADMIETNINARAVAALMSFLDSEGILHCAYCPNRFRLKEYKGKRLCDKHLEIDQVRQVQMDQKEKLAIIK